MIRNKAEISWEMFFLFRRINIRSLIIDIKNCIRRLIDFLLMNFFRQDICKLFLKESKRRNLGFRIIIFSNNSFCNFEVWRFLFTQGEFSMLCIRFIAQLLYAELPGKYNSNFKRYKNEFHVKWMPQFGNIIHYLYMYSTETCRSEFPTPWNSEKSFCGTLTILKWKQFSDIFSPWSFFKKLSVHSEQNRYFTEPPKKVPEFSKRIQSLKKRIKKSTKPFLSSAQQKKFSKD